MLILRAGLQQRSYVLPVVLKMFSRCYCCNIISEKFVLSVTQKPTPSPCFLRLTKSIHSNTITDNIHKNLVEEQKDTKITQLTDESKTKNDYDNKATESQSPTNETLESIYKRFEQESDLLQLKPNLPSHASSLAAFVNNSETLTSLVKLGVNLSKIEQDKTLASAILRMDFENDVKPIIMFLNAIGVKNSDLATVFNKNANIFTEDLEDMKVRVNYFESKKFSSKDISMIVTKAPKVLSMTTVEIDKHLGFIQKEFILRGKQVRQLVVSYPPIIYFPLVRLSENKLAYKDFFGFRSWELRRILLNRPVVITLDTDRLTEQFDYLHNTMGISHSTIVNWPDIMNSRLSKTKQRHEFLELIKKVQYNPQKPNYVTLKNLVAITDEEFCEKIAKVDIDTYNNYLKTL